jgi:hypothetical protein
MIVTISSGSHVRFEDATDAPAGAQFAHYFDPDDAEAVPNQAQNFVTYATALGDYGTPFVLYSPPRCDDEAQWAYICVEMADWRQIVESGTGVKVEIR